MGTPLEPTAAALGRLARELASGSHPEADAAQDAWLAWLRKPTAGTELLAWLRGARRRGARSIRRDEARRREREARASAAGGVEGPLDSLLRLERARTLLAAVESLEEPYRTAVVARFFEDLPPRTLARRLGIPVNTARSRVRRGLEELRRKLDPETLLALAPLHELPRRSPLERSGPLVALGLTSLLAVFAWRAWRAEDHAPLRSGALPVAGAPLARAASVAPTASEREALAPAPPAPAVPLSAVVAGPRLARVSGRLVDERGLPSAGVPVRIEVGSVYVAAEPRDALRGMRSLVPAVAHHASSDDDGRFELEFDADPVVGYELWIDQGDFVRVWRELGRLEPGSHELGTLLLRPGATLIGRIVTPEGKPCVGGWFVTLSGTGEEGEEEEQLTLSAQVLEPSGEFRFERVPPGRCVLRAEARLQAACEPLALELHAGETRRVELPYAGPELARRALVVLSSARARMPRLAPEALCWETGEERRTPARLFANGFLFDALPEGAGTLTLRDERYEALRRTDVHAGRVIELEVRGSAGLRLDVRGADGAPLSRHRAAWIPRDVAGVGELLLDGDAQPGGTVLAGLFPGSGVLVVGADGHGEEELELELRPGVLHPALVQLRASFSVQGIVQDEAGRPLAGLVVSVLRPARIEDSLASPVLRLGLELEGSGLERYRREIARVRSDTEGRFRVSLAAGPHVLAILPPESVLPVALSVTVAEDGPATGIFLTLPESSRRR